MASPSLSRGRIEAAPGEVLGRVAWNKPLVRRVELPEGPVVVKDFRPMAPLLRALYGKALLRLEARAYRSLRGIPGVPAFRGEIDRLAIAIDWVKGVPLGRAAPPSWPRFFERLEKLVAALHRRGVFHLDLRQRRNILCDPEGGPWLVDFSTAVVLPPWALARLLAPLLSWLDRMAVLKFKARKAPEILTPEERRAAAVTELLSRAWPFYWIRKWARRGRRDNAH